MVKPWVESARATGRPTQWLTDPIGAEPKADHPIGSSVVDLIFSMANREVTFLSGTVAISRL